MIADQEIFDDNSLEACRQGNVDRVWSLLSEYHVERKRFTTYSTTTTHSDACLLLRFMLEIGSYSKDSITTLFFGACLCSEQGKSVEFIDLMDARLEKILSIDEDDHAEILAHMISRTLDTSGMSVVF